MGMMVGDRLREARHSQQLSLADVAGKASISAATLSRIETNKQSVDLALFLALAKILKSVPHELLGDNDEQRGDADPLVRKISALKSADRTRMWRDLAASNKTARKMHRSDLGQQVDELIAQFEYLKTEIESVRTRVRKR
jgi:transcriptional regulator with XRE-family HTH domain